MSSVSDLDIHNRLADFGWDAFLWKKGKSVHVLDLGKVEVVDVESPDDNPYGGTPGVVFEFSGRFFRKYGKTDSYGSTDWGGRFEEVFPVQKVVVEYK